MTLSIVLIVADQNTAAGSTDPVGPSLVAPQSDKPENFTVAEDGPLMQQAIARARATLADFLKLAERPRRGMSNFAVKYGLSTPRGTEYVWATVVRPLGLRIIATIDVDVRWSEDVKSGDLVMIDHRDIIDWMYVNRDRLVGNATLCALDAMSPSAERRALRERMHLDCSSLAPANLRRRDYGAAGFSSGCSEEK